MDYDVVVIGAGNGGLTAACSLAQRGVKTLLLERHNVPGGCATSFCRGRFEFEVALHQLSGLGSAEKPGPLRHTLGKLGVVDELEWVEMENLYRLLVSDDLDITLKADREATIQTLQEKFPAEKDNITAYFDLVYQFCVELITIYSSRDMDATPEKYPVYFEYAFMETQKVLDKFFTDPLLKMAVSIYWGYTGLPPTKQPFSDMAMLLFSYLELKPYHLKGGSQALSAAILEKFLQSGGEVRFNCGARKILIEDGRVTGVVTEHGETITTSYIVSNASTVSVYTEMIEPEHVPAEELKKLGGSTVGPSSITLYIGLDCEPREVGINETTNFLCTSTDMEAAFTASWDLDSRDDFTLVSCYNISDPDISPPGTSQVCIVDLKYGEPWLSIPPHQYFELKDKVASQILDRIEHHFPGFREHIEEIEVATPITHMRFLGTPGGAIYGFDQYAKDTNIFTPPGSLIKGLYFAGAWAGMGGFQPTLTSGTMAARQILKDIKRQAGVKI